MQQTIFIFIYVCHSRADLAKKLCKTTSVTFDFSGFLIKKNNPFKTGLLATEEMVKNKFKWFLLSLV